MNNNIYKLFIFFFTTSIALNSYAQEGFGTNTPNASSVIDLTSTNKGILFPRVALTSTDDTTTIPVTVTAIGTTTDEDSMFIYNTATAGTAPNNVSPGYYYWNGEKWVKLDHTEDSWIHDPVKASITLNTLSDGITTRTEATSLWYLRDDGKLIFGDPLSTGENGEVDNSGFVNIRRQTGTANVKVSATDGAAVFFLESYANNGGGPGIRFFKGRGTDSDDFSTQANVQDNDLLGGIQFWGYNNNTSRAAERQSFAASIQSHVDGTVLDNVNGGVPGNLVFRTSTNSSSPSIRMVISSEGNVGIGEQNPEKKLDVKGSFRVDGAVYKSIRQLDVDAGDVIEDTDYTLIISNNYIRGSSPDIVIPSPVLNEGRVLKIALGSSPNASLSGNFTYRGTNVTAILISNIPSVTLHSDGSTWYAVDGGY